MGNPESKPIQEKIRSQSIFSNSSMTKKTEIPKAISNNSQHLFKNACLKTILDEKILNITNFINRSLIKNNISISILHPYNIQLSTDYSENFKKNIEENNKYIDSFISNQNIYFVSSVTKEKLNLLNDQLVIKDIQSISSDNNIKSDVVHIKKIPIQIKKEIKKFSISKSPEPNIRSKSPPKDEKTLFKIDIKNISSILNESSINSNNNSENISLNENLFDRYNTENSSSSIIYKKKNLTPNVSNWDTNSTTNIGSNLSLNTEGKIDGNSYVELLKQKLEFQKKGFQDRNKPREKSKETLKNIVIEQKQSNTSPNKIDNTSKTKKQEFSKKIRIDNLNRLNKSPPRKKEETSPIIINKPSIEKQLHNSTYDNLKDKLNFNKQENTRQTSPEIKRSIVINDPNLINKFNRNKTPDNKILRINLSDLSNDELFKPNPVKKVHITQIESDRISLRDSYNDRLSFNRRNTPKFEAKNITFEPEIDRFSFRSMPKKDIQLNFDITEDINDHELNEVKGIDDSLN